MEVVRVITFSVSRVLHYESGMLINICMYICVRSLDAGRNFEPIFTNLLGCCGFTLGQTLFLEKIGSM